MKPKLNTAMLEKAIAEDRLVFHYQPVISLFTGKICGAESLIRWKQPDGSLVLPDVFIPFAEKTGFINQMTRAMLPKFVEDLAALNALDPSLFLSFNVSPKIFNDDSFLKVLRRTTSGKLARLENFYLEITERSLLRNDDAARKMLRDMDAQGISIVLNDFSAGYTTLSTLTELPLKAIKLAMNITQKAPTSRSDFRLFRHLVGMAHQLHLDLMAEGVENYETHTLMLATGCTHSQGYYYSRALPFSDFAELLGKEPRWLEYPLGLEYLAQTDLVDFRRDIIKTALIIYTDKDKGVRERALARLPELDSRKSLLGRWYENIEYRNKEKEAYRQLGMELEKFHELSNTLLEQASSGENWDEINRTISLFSKTSITIMELIQGFEIKELLDYFKI